MKRTLTLLLLILICTGSYAQRTKHQQPEPVAELPVKSFAEQLRDDYTAFYQNGGIFEKLTDTYKLRHEPILLSLKVRWNGPRVE